VILLVIREEEAALAVLPGPRRPSEAMDVYERKK
jgi:hypothetical protein